MASCLALEKADVEDAILEGNQVPCSLISTINSIDFDCDSTAVLLSFFLFLIPLAYCLRMFECVCASEVSDWVAPQCDCCVSLWWKCLFHFHRLIAWSSSLWPRVFHTWCSTIRTLSQMKQVEWKWTHIVSQIHSVRINCWEDIKLTFYLAELTYFDNRNQDTT